MKQSYLEVRLVYVRKSSRTESHVLIVMLAYRIILELDRLWQNIGMTTKEAIDSLNRICSFEILQKTKEKTKNSSDTNDEDNKSASTNLLTTTNNDTDNNRAKCIKLMIPDEINKKLLEKLNITLPTVFSPNMDSKVATK